MLIHFSTTLYGLGLSSKISNLKYAVRKKKPKLFFRPTSKNKTFQFSITQLSKNSHIILIFLLLFLESCRKHLRIEEKKNYRTFYLNSPL